MDPSEARPFLDPYGRAKTVRIGKWRWPPPKSEQDESSDSFLQFKMRQHQRKTTPQQQLHSQVCLVLKGTEMNATDISLNFVISYYTCVSFSSYFLCKSYYHLYAEVKWLSLMSHLILNPEAQYPNMILVVFLCPSMQMP
jgi:hypothetical protein